MHHTEALILKKDEWGEADWLITALSADFGKIRLLAQGARKHGAKLQGHLEPGSVSGLSFVVGRNGYRLTGARLAAFPTAVRGSLSKTRALNIILQAFDANLLEEPDRAPELFRLAEETLGALCTAEHLTAVRRLTAWFHTRLAMLLGVFPSPRSPEARRVPSLLKIADCPPARLDASGLEPDALERELTWLIQKLGGGLAAIGPVSTGAPAIDPVG